MNAVFILLPVAIAMGGVFAWLFLRAVKEGQFDDVWLDDAPERILRE